LDLTELTDEPDLTVTIGGEPYHFSELPIGSLAKLQSWIKANVPDPLVALRERLQGYPESVAAQVASDVRREYPTWPPVIGSPKAAVAMMDQQPGQVYAFWIGLLVHQPATTIEAAERLYRTLKKMRDEKKVRRIFQTIFDMAPSERDEDGEGDPGPKGEGTATAASNGSSTSAQPNSDSR
jgi:hypothetical protein